MNRNELLCVKFLQNDPHKYFMHSISYERCGYFCNYFKDETMYLVGFKAHALSRFHSQA